MDGKALREARKTKNWTQTDAAKVLGVTQAYLSMIESGSRVLAMRPTETRLTVTEARRHPNCLP
jgi:transcriptional regulator with XRE-family HTH domain